MAPVLASLDKVTGVLESRVDWTGRRFLLKIDTEVSADTVASRANEAIGGDSRRLDPEAESQATASFLRGTETWMRSGETLKLSRTEARVLAERYGKEAADGAGLDEPQTEKLIGIMEREVAAAFERIHADGQGLPSNFGAIFGDALTSTLEKSRAFLSPDQLQKVKEYCESKSGR